MIKLTQESKKTTLITEYDEIPTGQMFRGIALNGPHFGSTGVYLKAAAGKGGEFVKESILYRLDGAIPFKNYVGSKSDFKEYAPLDAEMIVKETR